MLIFHRQKSIQSQKLEKVHVRCLYIVCSLCITPYPCRTPAVTPPVKTGGFLQMGKTTPVLCPKILLVHHRVNPFKQLYKATSLPFGDKKKKKNFWLFSFSSLANCARFGLPLEQVVGLLSSCFSSSTQSLPSTGVFFHPRGYSLCPPSL